MHKINLLLSVTLLTFDDMLILNILLVENIDHRHDYGKRTKPFISKLVVFIGNYI